MNPCQPPLKYGPVACPSADRRVTVLLRRGTARRCCAGMQALLSKPFEQLWAQPNHGVTFSMADARRPFMTASETVWQAFEPELQRRLTKVDAAAPLSDRVRSVLLESLPSGDASIDVTARRLGLSSRTLQRRLKGEGTSP